MAALGAGHHSQPLLFRQLAGGDEAPDADRVGGDRLLAENVLAGVDTGLEVLGAEAGRSGQDHVVDIGLEQLLVGVEADELALLRDIEPLERAALAGRVGQGLEALLQVVLVEVGHRHQPDVRRGEQHVLRRPGAAPAAADHPDLDQVGVLPVGVAQDRKPGQGAGGGHAPGTDEFPAVRVASTGPVAHLALLGIVMGIMPGTTVRCGVPGTGGRAAVRPSSAAETGCRRLVRQYNRPYLVREEYFARVRTGRAPGMGT